jgi:hypothetical protein
MGTRIDYLGKKDVEIDLIVEQLTKDINSSNPSLCGKWAPTEGCHFDKTTKIVNKICKKMNISFRDYRKIITSLRSKIRIIESKLSTERTNEITFSEIPAKAHLQYKSVFLRDVNSKKEFKQNRKELKERYDIYMSKLSKGEEKVKFSGVMPHELVMKTFKEGKSELIENQWKSLRDDIKNLSIFDNSISIVDVSGSMGDLHSKDVKPIHISISLGILVSECSKGIYKDKMFTFHENPTLTNLSGCSDLHSKINHCSKMPWGGTTNLEKVFDQILDAGVLFNVKPEQFHEKLFIFTDIQINSVTV